MSLALDPYTTLGVAPEADGASIRQAFRRLARELHPDHNADPEAAQAFIRVRAAYEWLTDPERAEEAEAEAVMAAVERAAAEAMQQRVRPIRTAPPVCVPLHSWRARVPGLPRAVALRVAAALAVSGVGLLALATMAGVGMGIAGGLCGMLASSVWLTRRQEQQFRFYADHLTDPRWKGGHIRWGDVHALEANLATGMLDLRLTIELADSMASVDGFPRGALVWHAGKPFYRLPVGAWLPDLVALIEARTGLRAS